MSELIPSNIDELVEAIRNTPRLLARSGNTKPCLSNATGYTVLSTQALCGITEYLPDEYTITVKAGTSLRELEAALSENKQYLPFDPPLSASGATVGGTVAAGLSDPGRLRYGGVRDFVIGVTLVTGTGRVVRGGGKVVKNAAGFDLPKFMVGSQGRFGLLSDVTFKVFPRVPQHFTWELPFSYFTELAASNIPFDGIEYAVESQQCLIRTGGHRAIKPHPQATQLEGDPWTVLQELTWANDYPVLAKIPLQASGMNAFIAGITGRRHISMAGNLGWVATNDSAKLDQELAALKLNGLCIRGPEEHRGLGLQPTDPTLPRLRQLFDPERRFPSYQHTESEVACSTA